MPDDWDRVAAEHGKVSVMSTQISDEVLERETARQIPILFGLLEKQLLGHERTAIDFGCGSGRFSHALAQTIKGRVTAFDPCKGLIALATGHTDVDHFTTSTDRFIAECERNGTVYDVVFAFNVLGSPTLNLEHTAADLVSLVAPNGLLFVADHMPDIIPSGRWWRFRSMVLYEELFRRNGIEMRHVGNLMQLENQVSVLAGRRV